MAASYKGTWIRNRVASAAGYQTNLQEWWWLSKARHWQGQKTNPHIGSSRTTIRTTYATELQGREFAFRWSA